MNIDTAEEAALPQSIKDAVAHASAPVDVANRTPLRVAMLAYTYYESDGRVMRYAEALARRGDSVDVVSLNSRGSSSTAHSGVRLFGLQTREHNERGKFDYLVKLLAFTLRAFFFFCRPSAKYDVIHVHNIPDFLVFAVIIPKLRGAKIFLDIHDVVPEFYVSKFSVDEKSFTIRALKSIERASARFANHVIISNDLWFDKVTGRSVSPRNCSVFINYIDPILFKRRSRTRNDGKFIILFPGGLQWHQGLDIAIRAFNLIKDRVPNAEFHIYGQGNAKSDLVALTNDLGLQDRVRFFPGRPLNEIVQIIADADLGVVPKRANSFGNEAYSTKIMEFMSQGVPMIVSRTKIDTFYFNDKVVRFFESGNERELADAMLELSSNDKLRESLVTNAFEFLGKNSWDHRQHDYLRVVDSLVG